jgi:aryl-alcohol dehydrogenase-like predicted oxidoreductase
MAEQNVLGGTFRLGDREVHRMGFGAMQLAGPHVYGPPQDPVEVAAVLRAAVEAGVNHIDTSDFYGPHVVNRLIKETLHPYRDGLVLVTKLGARRTSDAGWRPAQSPAELRAGAEDNLRNLGLDVLEVVNLRLWSGGNLPPANREFRPQLETMLELQREGKIKHIGLSNAHPLQVEAAVKMAEIVCVQNHYGVLHRADDELVEFCADRGIAFVPFFPLGGGLSPLQAEALDAVAAELGATPHQVALAWLLHGTENMLLIPGTSKVAHLKQNLAAASLKLSAEQLRRLDG